MLRRLLLILVVSGWAPTALAQRVAQPPWWDRAPEQKVGYYWIKTDLPPRDANRLARHLNLMYEEYASRLAHLPQRAPEKLNVLIFAERRDYLDVLRQRFGVNALGTAGVFFVNEIGAALALWVERLPERRIQHVMQHEGFHQFAYSRFGNDLPIWVNEGLAEFFAESVMVGGRLVLGQSKPRIIDSVKEAISEGRHVPFRKMLSMSHDEWGAALRNGTAGPRYHQAWSMVHFLVYGDGAKYQAAFEAYLRMLNSGVLSEEAFARAFGPDIQAFEDRWQKVALATRPSAFLTAMERIEFLAEGALALSRRGLVPTSLEELEQHLQEIGFTHTLIKHGLDVLLRADDPSLYVIPQDALTEEQPQFLVEKPRLHHLPRRLLALEHDQPTPSAIRTRSLEPRNLAVQWRRDPESSAFSYEIVVK